MTVEIISWSFSTKVWYRAGIELATPGSAVRHASVARHVTDCATRPSLNFLNKNDLFGKMLNCTHCQNIFCSYKLENSNKQNCSVIAAKQMKVKILCLTMFFFQLTTDEPKPQKKDIDTVKEVGCRKPFSGRVLGSRLRGCGFKPHRSLILVSLSKTH